MSEEVQERAAFALAVAERLIAKEGVRLTPYVDTTGHVTIAAGVNLDEGLSLTVAMCLFAVKLGQVIGDLNAHAPWWHDMPVPARLALADMAYNLGWPKLSKFAKMLAALRARDYETGAKEALDSTWATQVGQRAFEVAALYQHAAREAGHET